MSESKKAVHQFMTTADESKMSAAEILNSILHYKKNIEKIADTTERALRNEERLLYCISKLYKLPVQTSHLHETGVGRTVNALRKIEGEKGLGDAARALVYKWKNMVLQEDQEQDDTKEDEEARSESPPSPSGPSESDLERIRLIRKAQEKSNHKRLSTENDVRSPCNEKKRKINNNDDEAAAHSSKRLYNMDSDDECGNLEINGFNSSDESKSHVSHSDSSKYTKSKDDYRNSSNSRHSSKDDKTSNSSKDKKIKESSPKQKSSTSKVKDKSGSRHNSSSSNYKDYKDSASTKSDRESSKSGHKESSSSKEYKSSSNSRHKSSSSSDKKHKESYSSSKRDLNSTDKTNQESSSNSHKGSSSSKNNKDSNTKEHPSSSKHKEHSSKTKNSSKMSVSGDSSEELDSMSGASFAAALGPIIVKKNKKKTSSSTTSHSTTTYIPTTIPTKKSSPSTADMLSSSVELPPLDLNLGLALPTPATHYKPLPSISYEDHPKRKKQHEDDALVNIMSNKNQRTKVFSGAKVGYTQVPSLYELCCRVLQQHIDAMEFTGGVPYSLLKPVIDGASPAQLMQFEHFNPYIMEETDHLWKFHVNKEFRGIERQEFESWREMYLRCIDEREERYKAVTANIQKSIKQSVPLRTTKLAYVDVAKPPRNVIKQQLKNGTGKPDTNRLIGKLNPDAVRVPPPKQPSAREPNINAIFKIKPKVAPLMQKTLKSIKNTRFKR